MKKKILVVLLILIFIYCIGGVVYSLFINQKDNDKEIKTILEIENYNYKIDENSVNNLYKNEFKSLKSNLESNEINFLEYAKSIAKLYIIDLYSLKNKTNKYDVTAIQYINEGNRDNFKLKVSETIYKYIEDNTDNKRNQELPLVSEIFIKNLENTIYMVGSTEYEAYSIDVEWLYEKELGYDTNANIILIKNGNVISVVEEKRVEIVE